MEIIALVIILGWLAISTIVAILAGVLKKFSLEEWTVASRAISFPILYFALAAEIYSAFTFLGLAGWAVSYGAPIYYALAYFVTAYSTGFILAPYYNRFSRKYGYITQPDLFLDRYESRLLGILVAALGIGFLLPYIQLQIQGVGIIVETASYGAIDRTTAILIAFILTAVFIFIGGLRGIAWTNVLQGILMFVAAFICLGVPLMAFGDVGTLFDKLIASYPKHLTLPGAAGVHGIPWYMSTLALTTLGFWMFPHLVSRAFAGKTEKIPMRSCAWMSWYSILAVPIVLVGFTALVLGLKLPAPDYAVMLSVIKFYPPWVVGLIGAGGLAAAVSTGAGLIQATATLTARNIVQRGLWPKASDITTAWIARSLSIVVTLICLYLALYVPSLLVNLLLIAYSGVVQFLPGTFYAFAWKRATKAGVISGIIAGTIVVILTTFVWVNPLMINSGIWGLAVNFIVSYLVSLVTKPPSEATIKKFFT